MGGCARDNDGGEERRPALFSTIFMRRTTDNSSSNEDVISHHSKLKRMINDRRVALLLVCDYDRKLKHLTGVDARRKHGGGGGDVAKNQLVDMRRQLLV